MKIQKFNEYYNSGEWTSGKRNTGTEKPQNKKLYYRIEFENCTLDYDYTICSRIEQINELVSKVRIDLEDPKANIYITGVMLTTDEYNEFLKSIS